MTESKSNDAAVGVAIGVAACPDQESPLAAEKTDEKTDDEPTVTAGTDKAAVDIAGTTISTSKMMTEGSTNASGKAAELKQPAVGVPSPPESHQDTPKTNSSKEEMEQIKSSASEEIQDPDASAIDAAMADIAGASMSKTAMAHGTSTNSNKTAAQPVTVISKREQEGVRIHSSSKHHDPLAPSMQPEVQPLPLRRSAQQQLSGSPGAFATNTGINFQQQQQALPTTTSTSSPWPDENSSQFLCPSNNNYLSGSDDGLVEAIPVLEEEEERDPENNVMAEAQEIDIQELQERKAAREADRKRKERNCRKMGFGMVLLCILVVAAIILGVSLGKNKKKKNDSHTSDTTETLAPSSEFLRSIEPSPTPSFAPTGPLDQLITQLPASTLERLNRGSHEPQWKAWNWLANHPNITTTNLPEWRKMQLFALATFFYSFAGEHWNPLMKQRWMDYTMEECHWYSGGAGYFTEDGEYIEKPADQQLDPCNEMGEFVYLDVNGLELGGIIEVIPSIPREIVLLTSLVAINLNDNDVHAPLHAILPAELYYEMTSLTDLSFRVNQLTGTLPTELGLLTSLEQMNLFRNSLTGSVPSELALLTNLDKIALFENSLSGSLPTTLGALTNVTVLWLYQNSFTGEIPFQYLQTLTNLKEARLEDNRFSGAIGTEVGLLLSLELLHLHQNQLTNTIPTEVGIMTALKELYLQNNNLSGELPKELNASLALRLDGNGFEGTVPPNLCTVLWCDDCSSTNNNVSLVSTCSDLEEGALDWPGRFPRESQTNNGELWINILTDEFPGDTMWLWQRAGNGTSWKNVTGSNGALQASKHLHTYPLTLVPDSAYRFVVSDGYGDGFWRNGWITMILGTNATVIYAFGADGESSSFSEVVVVIEVASDGSPELSATVA